MFKRFRSALAAWIAPTPAPVSTPAPSTGPADIPHPDDYADGAAFYAAVQAAAARMRADEVTNTTGAVHDGGRAVQARDIQDIHMGTHTHHHDEVHHHTGGTVTNHAPGATVGAQMGNVTGGVVNVNSVRTNNGGQVIQGGNVTDGIQYGGGGIVNMGGTNTFANTAIGHGATIHTGHGDINQNS